MINSILSGMLLIAALVLGQVSSVLASPKFYQTEGFKKEKTSLTYRPAMDENDIEDWPTGYLSIADVQQIIDKAKAPNPKVPAKQAQVSYLTTVGVKPVKTKIFKK